MDRALDHAVDATDAVAGAASKGIKAGATKLSNKLTGSQTTALLALPGNIAGGAPSATVNANNTSISSQALLPSVNPYPSTPAVSLPNPDAPTQVGPAADRQWLVDTLSWSETMQPLTVFSGPKALTPGVYPPPSNLTLVSIPYQLHSVFPILNLSSPLPTMPTPTSTVVSTSQSS